MKLFSYANHAVDDFDFERTLGSELEFRKHGSVYLLDGENLFISQIMYLKILNVKLFIKNIIN